MKMFRKNLCDKVSKIKNLRWLSCSFFRADRRGILCFFGRRIFPRENCKTKSPVLTFFRLPTTLEGPGAMNMASKNTVPKNPDVSKPQIKNNKETFDNNIHIVAVIMASKSVKHIWQQKNVVAGENLPYVSGP